jgi:phage shock protein C
MKNFSRSQSGTFRQEEAYLIQSKDGRRAMYCNYCGKVIQDDANVCAYCGKQVAAVCVRRRLIRLKTGRKIAGVCAGFAEYFGVDVTLVRLLWIVLGICMFPFLEIAYIVAWIIVPDEPQVLTIVPAGTPVSAQQG